MNLPERVQFRGVCNRCGLCCQFEAPDGSGLVRCGYLRVHTRVGEPEATHCVMYETRVDGMAIPMRYVGRNEFYGWRRCAKDSPLEDWAIRQRGIGQGCSLEIVHA